MAACGPRPRHVRIDPALATLVPPEAIALAGVRLDRLRQAAAYKQLRPVLETNPVARLTQRAGDAFADLWELLAVVTPDDAVWMARGRFSPSGMEPRVSWDGARRTTYRNHLLITDGERAIVFMNATTAVAGNPERLRKIIDQRDSDVKPPGDLLALAYTIDGSNQIWAVAQGGRSFPAVVPGALGHTLSEVLPKLRHARVMVDVQDRVLLRADGECFTPEDAETLRSALKAFIGLAKLQKKGAPALRKLLEQASVTGEASTVGFTVEAPPDLLRALLVREPAP